MPFLFTNEEYADMVYLYGYCNGSATRAANLYAERYPNRRPPCNKTIQNCFQSLRERGSFHKSTSERAVPRRDGAEAVLRAVEQDERISIRRIAAVTGQSRTSVHTTLHENGLYPYHLQSVHNLHPNDYVPRQIFSRWILENEELISVTLFSDEATFTRNGITNLHNEHVWDIENPHAISENNFQHRFSVNVWGGIIDNVLLGPHIFDGNLNSLMYRDFLRDQLPLLLENVPLNVRRQMWLQQDGAPAHHGRIVADLLSTMFPNRWIGRNGPVHWPARSPDFNPMDYYFWGHVKTIVYGQGKPNTREELLVRIEQAFNDIRGRLGNVDWQRALIRRAELCLDVHGAHVEQL